MGGLSRAHAVLTGLVLSGDLHQHLVDFDAYIRRCKLLSIEGPLFKVLLLWFSQATVAYCALRSMLCRWFGSVRSLHFWRELFRGKTRHVAAGTKRVVWCGGAVEEEPLCSRCR